MTTSPAPESSEEAFRRIRDMDVSVNEQLKAWAESARQRRPEFANAIDRLVNRLQENGAGQTAPTVGEPMPPFILPDESGRLVGLEQLAARGPVAVTFHRGHWCPYCRINVNALARAHQTISANGGQIVAVIPDIQKFAAEMKSKSSIPFSILTDMDNGYALSLNLAIWVGEEMQKLMADRQNLPEYQGNDSWILPIPATFVVGTDGVIKARFIDPDYRKRMEIDDLIAALRS
jgi:peroxiredoxin